MADNEDDNLENAIHGGVIERAADAADDLVKANRKTLVGDTEVRLNNDYESLNIDQKGVVDKIVESLSKRDGVTSLKIVVSDLGGTGKSRVISIFRRLI